MKIKRYGKEILGVVLILKIYNNVYIKCRVEVVIMIDIYYDGIDK